MLVHVRVLSRGMILKVTNVPVRARERAVSEEPKAMVKLRKRTGGRGYESYEVTIPKEIVKRLGWRPGDKLVVEIKEQRVVIYRL